MAQLHVTVGAEHFTSLLSQDDRVDGDDAEATNQETDAISLFTDVGDETRSALKRLLGTVTPHVVLTLQSNMTLWHLGYCTTRELSHSVPSLALHISYFVCVCICLGHHDVVCEALCEDGIVIQLMALLVSWCSFLSIFSFYSRALSLFSNDDSFLLFLGGG